MYALVDVRNSPARSQLSSRRGVVESPRTSPLSPRRHRQAAVLATSSRDEREKRAEGQLISAGHARVHGIAVVVVARSAQTAPAGAANRLLKQPDRESSNFKSAARCTSVCRTSSEQRSEQLRPRRSRESREPSLIPSLCQHILHDCMLSRS